MKQLSWRIFLFCLLALGVRSEADFDVGAPVEVLWGGTWYKAKVIGLEGGKWKISYDGYGSNWDQVVGADHIRARGAPGNGGDATTAQVGPKADLSFPSRPTDKRAGLEGVYLRVESYSFNGRLSITNEGWFFTKEGRVSRSPSGGFNFDEFRSTKTARPSDGVYWIEGKNLTIIWAETGKPTTFEFAQKGDEIHLNGIGATRVEGFKRGWRVDAAYEGGSSAVGSGGYLAGSNSLDLRSDGTFGSGAVSTISMNSDRSSISGGSSSESAGTYDFNGYTLTLKHTDGRIERHTVFAFDQDTQGAPGYIWRDGTMMRRQDRKK